MELWFIAALGGALFAGASNFFFKIAAVRGYNAKLFSLYGSFTSISLAGIAFVVTNQTIPEINWLLVLVFFSGTLASIAGILKIYALRNIDSTIFFPLFKLVAPALAIVAGVLFFDESFSKLEWLGMALGLTVPLLLITKSENGRQNNLLHGLLLVVVIGFLSAASAVIGKLAIDAGISALVTLLSVVLGILLGTVVIMILRNGASSILELVKTETSIPLIIVAGLRAGLIVISLFAMLFAYSKGGPLAVVQTVHSMYILIPIVLSIYFYEEHWNIQKGLAIALSVAALFFLQ